MSEGGNLIIPLRPMEPECTRWLVDDISMRSTEAKRTHALGRLHKQHGHPGMESMIKFLEDAGDKQEEDKKLLGEIKAECERCLLVTKGTLTPKITKHGVS